METSLVELEDTKLYSILTDKCHLTLYLKGVPSGGAPTLAGTSMLNAAWGLWY